MDRSRTKYFTCKLPRKDTRGAKETRLSTRKLFSGRVVTRNGQAWKRNGASLQPLLKEQLAFCILGIWQRRDILSGTLRKCRMVGGSLQRGGDLHLPGDRKRGHRRPISDLLYFRFRVYATNCFWRVNWILFVDVLEHREKLYKRKRALAFYPAEEEIAGLVFLKLCRSLSNSNSMVIPSERTTF